MPAIKLQVEFIKTHDVVLFERKIREFLEVIGPDSLVSLDFLNLSFNDPKYLCVIVYRAT